MMSLIGRFGHLVYVTLLLNLLVLANTQLAELDPVISNSSASTVIPVTLGAGDLNVTGINSTNSGKVHTGYRELSLSEDDKFKSFYKCYCHGIEVKYNTTLPCDIMEQNARNKNESANDEILREHGVPDTLETRLSLGYLSMKCALKVYYKTVYNCYCKSIETSFKTKKLPCKQMRENTKNGKEYENDKILMENGVVFHWYTRIKLGELWMECVYKSIRRAQKKLKRLETEAQQVNGVSNATQSAETNITKPNK